MTAARTYALDDTQPIPRVDCGMLRQNWQVGDRVTDVVVIAGREFRFLGIVGESTAFVFRVRWDGGHGIGTYTHGHEPNSLRRPTAADERAAAGDAVLLALAADLGRARAARELRVAAFEHPEWGAPVVAELHRRARKLGE